MKMTRYILSLASQPLYLAGVYEEPVFTPVPERGEYYDKVEGAVAARERVKGHDLVVVRIEREPI